MYITKHPRSYTEINSSIFQVMGGGVLLSTQECDLVCAFTHLVQSRAVFHMRCTACPNLMQFLDAYIIKRIDTRKDIAKPLRLLAVRLQV